MRNLEFCCSPRLGAMEQNSIPHWHDTVWNTPKVDRVKPKNHIGMTIKGNVKIKSALV